MKWVQITFKSYLLFLVTPHFLLISGLDFPIMSLLNRTLCVIYPSLIRTFCVLSTINPPLTCFYPHAFFLSCVLLFRVKAYELPLFCLCAPINHSLSFLYIFFSETKHPSNFHTFNIWADIVRIVAVQKYVMHSYN